MCTKGLGGYVADCFYGACGKDNLLIAAVLLGTLV